MRKTMGYCELTVSDLHRLQSAGKVRYHHSAWIQGYVSRKSKGRVCRYRGKFGEGYALLEPSWQSTRFCNVTYYIIEP